VTSLPPWITVLDTEPQKDVFQLLKSVAALIEAHSALDQLWTFSSPTALNWVAPWARASSTEWYQSP
jgi:hypothetical protein